MESQQFLKLISCLVWCDLVQRDTQAFWQPHSGVNEAQLKATCCFVLDISRELIHKHWPTNTLTQRHIHTHNRLSGLPFMLQRQPLLLEMSMALLCQPHYRDRDVGKKAKEGTFHYLQSANSPSLGAQPWGKESFKQPRISEHCTQTHRPKHTVHTPLCNHKLYTYTATH